MTRTPSEDSDQSGHPSSLIRVFAARMKKPWIISYPVTGCPGWSESSLCAKVILLVLLCGSSFWIVQDWLCNLHFTSTETLNFFCSLWSWQRTKQIKWKSRTRGQVKGDLKNRRVAFTINFDFVKHHPRIPRLKWAESSERGTSGPGGGVTA